MLLRVFLPLLILAGCTTAPQLDGGTSRDLERADYPTLVPIEQILGSTRADPAADQQVEDQLDARLAALQARASRLKASQIDPATRKRLEDGVARP